MIYNGTSQYNQKYHRMSIICNYKVNSYDSKALASQTQPCTNKILNCKLFDYFLYNYF